MNSVHLFVKDAVGNIFLSTFTANTSDAVSDFRKHVASCKRYWKTKAYRDKVPSYRWPCEPVEIFVEPYEDVSQ